MCNNASRRLFCGLLDEVSELVAGFCKQALGGRVCVWTERCCLGLKTSSFCMFAVWTIFRAVHDSQLMLLQSLIFVNDWRVCDLQFELWSLWSLIFRIREQVVLFQLLVNF